MNKEDQLGFDFSPPATDELSAFPHDPLAKGYEFFVAERDAAIERINKRFGAMIHEKVRLKLFGWDDEFKGKLMLDTLLLPKSKKDDVPLRVGRVTFDLRDVEHCFRI